LEFVVSLLKTAAVAAALSIAGQMAGASTFLDYQGLAGYGHARVSGVGSDVDPYYSGRGGAFKMYDATDELGLGKDFIAFCIDLAGHVGDGDYYINNDAPFDPERKLTDFQKSNVENLFQASYAHVDVYDNVQAAAFQLALWEAAYETDETRALSLDDGNRFGTSSNTAIKDKADEYLLKLANWDGTKLFHVNFLDAEKLGRQDLVTATPVPLPAAGVLLIAGLGALGAMKRRASRG
jgi:hypothetical protein